MKATLTTIFAALIFISVDIGVALSGDGHKLDLWQWLLIIPLSICAMALEVFLVLFIYDSIKDGE